MLQFNHLFHSFYMTNDKVDISQQQPEQQLHNLSVSSGKYFGRPPLLATDPGLMMTLTTHHRSEPEGGEKFVSSHG